MQKSDCVPKEGILKIVSCFFGKVKEAGNIGAKICDFPCFFVRLLKGGNFFEGGLFPFAILKNANFFQKNRKKIMRIFYTIEMQV